MDGITGFRDLQPEEWELISGGNDTDTDHDGIPGWTNIGAGGWTYYGPPGGGIGTGGYGGGSTGGGSGGSELTIIDIPDAEDDDCKNGAALKVAEFIKVAADLDNDAHNDGEFELSAYLVNNGDGTYGAMSDELYTKYQAGTTSFPGTSEMTTGEVNSIYGMIHNHMYNHSDLWVNYINRYPSPADWAGLQALANSHNDPSSLRMYIVDPWGTVREFKLADKALFESLTDTQRKNGVDLPSATTDCTP